MTQEVKRKPADVLREARRRDSDRKRDGVFRAVDAMRREGIPITFASVARAAKVSQWLVYAEGVREYILSARAAQAAEPVDALGRGRAASEASLRTDLELAKQDNRRLREELARLKVALRERLGSQLEAESAESLRRRIDELTAASQRYRCENSRLAEELANVQTQLRATENDLGAARTSLRRMIREQARKSAQKVDIHDAPGRFG